MDQFWKIHVTTKRYPSNNFQLNLLIAGTKALDIHGDENMFLFLAYVCNNLCFIYTKQLLRCWFATFLDNGRWR